jgi:hypothetical protein
MAGYVNPFGGYSAGYGQGVGQEVALQQGARQAREEDWQHQYMDPLRLSEAKRNDTYGNAALQPQIDSLAPGLQMLRDKAAGSQLGLASQYSVDLGQTGQLEDMSRRMFPGAPQQSSDQLARRADFDHNLQMFGMQNRQLMGEAAQTRADAMEEHYGRPYGQAGGGFNIDSLFGPPATQAAPAPTGAPAPAPATPAPAPASTLSPENKAAAAQWTPEVEARYRAMHASPGSPQASAVPFHAMYPEHQGHVINAVAQAMGVPHEQALAHIQSQPGGMAPQAAPPGVDATQYYNAA